MSSSKIRKLRSIFTANTGCGCGPKATEVIEPKPKSDISSSNQKSSHCASSSDSYSERHRGGGGGKSAVDDDDCTSTTFSLNMDASPHFCLHDQTKFSLNMDASPHFCLHDQTKFSTTVSPCSKIQGSFAVVKDSDDPYQDFRQSMLQMIFEKEIYSRNDLQQLLDRFLQLNSPRHHELIVQAFIEIWSGGIPATGNGSKATEPPPCSSTKFTCENVDN